MVDVVPGVTWGDGCAGVSECAPQLALGLGLSLADVVLDLGERHLDGIRVWAVGRNEVPVR